MQLVLVSGLSGSGKSIALDVLEDSGYYCVDNLPATLLLDVVKFLGEAGHERIAISIDARSVALASLPEHLATLKARGVESTLLFLEASSQTLLRRFSETRRGHPLAGSSQAPGLTLDEAIARERSLLSGISELGSFNQSESCGVSTVSRSEGHCDFAVQSLQLQSACTEQAPLRNWELPQQLLYSRHLSRGCQLRQLCPRAP